MLKKRIIADPLLMFVTILIVTGFQGYWLKNNYDREKKAMQIKTGFFFQETVRKLQARKLNLRDPFPDARHKGKMKVFINEDLQNEDMHVKVLPQKEIVNLVDAMRDKLEDSLKNAKVGSAVVISMNSNETLRRDSGNQTYIRKGVKGGDEIFQVLYGIDSLQDSLRISEITTSYKTRLLKENISLPFSIERANIGFDMGWNNDETDPSTVTVGLVHPVTYHLRLGNSFPYLLKKIALPILFSVFLVGLTILSFVLLYRSLLKQQRLAEIKNEFISNITHELKTPIATVGVAIEALKSFNAMQDPQKTREYLDISANELQRLSLLVDKVLKLSMFENKEIELKYETLNLASVVEEVVTSMRLQIEKYHASVSVEQHGDLNLEADRLHLLSVVFNLVDNALKYGKENPEIKIGMQGDEQNVSFSISDNGIGIAPEYQGKIFEKFFRVPMGNTHNAKGYGLGLSYVSHVVEKHNGKIEVESQPGIETSFVITIPKYKG
jgi:two-component system phosphate regulon sensor histidine kinase PhoR